MTEWWKQERESEKHYKGEGRREREGLGQGRAGLADFVRPCLSVFVFHV